jgi:hypothetical protein
MGPTSGYRQLWHLFAEGWGFCALGAFTVDGLAPQWRDLHSRLPLRDRYSATKTAQALVTYIEVVGQAPPSAATTPRQRLLYFVYQPWSKTLTPAAQPTPVPAPSAVASA